jgi:hypothetical protein
MSNEAIISTCHAADCVEMSVGWVCFDCGQPCQTTSPGRLWSRVKELEENERVLKDRLSEIQKILNH